MEKVITIECSECKGTGLYKGMAERGGAAVVCYKCKGEGKADFKYNEFTGRKDRNDVKRVYLSAYGYCITDEDVVREDGTTIHFSLYGCSYDDWKNGVTPTHIEELYCPKLGRIDDCEEVLPCDDLVGLGERIDKCSRFKSKLECWNIYFNTK